MSRAAQRGTAVILSVSVIVVLTTLGSTMLMRSLHEDQLGRRSADRQQAFALAEAGLDQSLLNLRTPAIPDDDKCIPGAIPNPCPLLTGSFTIDAPQDLGGNQWRVVTHGTSGSETRDTEAVFALTPQSVFQYSVFADQSLNVSGSAISNSYDSSLGPYNNDPNDPAYNAGHNGDVGTNGTTTGDVAVGGSIFVDGQVLVGPEAAANPYGVVTGYDPAFITGGTDPPSDTQDVVAQDLSFPMPPVIVDTPSFIAVLLDGDGDCLPMTVNGGDTVTLSATGGLGGQGIYCYSNLTLQGGSTFTADGDVTIYITGQLTAQGNSTVGVVNDPTKMLFKMSATAQADIQQTISGSNVFYGAIYGPGATINISGNAEIYGSVVGQQVNLTGSAVLHYDEALADETEISNMFSTSLFSWRELP